MDDVWIKGCRRVDEKLRKRDKKIDLYRGIAAIGVVSIHTAFWSGESYVPQWFQSLTLLIDVPYFFFIAGKSARFHEGSVVQTGRSLYKMWIKWIFAVSVLAVGCFIFKGGGITDFRDLLRNFWFHVSFEGLPVIGGSIWFMPYYIVVSLVNQVMLAILPYSGETFGDGKKWYCGLMLFAFCWTAAGHGFLGMDAYYLFYSFYWMLGIISPSLQIKHLKKLMQILFLVLTGYLLAGYYTDIPYMNLQQAKFPPQLPYLFASLIGIAFTVYFERHIKKPNPYVVHIGQNAFFYYIAQGVGSSMLYRILPMITTDLWFVKWGISFIANLLITVVTAEFFAAAYGWLEKFCKKVVWVVVNRN